MSDRKIMYVCEDCADACPEACGHFDPNDLFVMPDGAWLCETCAEELSSMSDHGVVPGGDDGDEWPALDTFAKPPQYSPAT